MIFAGVRMGPKKDIWYPTQSEKFIGLNGCKFFGSVAKDRRFWLTRVNIGSGAKGNAYILAEGTDRDPEKIIGWSGKGTTVFRDKVPDGHFGAVALVGIVADMTQFLPAAACKNKKEGAGSFCEVVEKRFEKYEAIWYDEGKYKGEKHEFGDWVDLNENKDENRASTGKGWIDIRAASIREEINGWKKPNFKRWMERQLHSAGWHLPIGLKTGTYLKLRWKEHADGDKRFLQEFRDQIAANGSDAGSRYEWKKTAVMTKKSKLCGIGCFRRMY